MSINFCQTERCDIPEDDDVFTLFCFVRASLTSSSRKLVRRNISAPLGGTFLIDGQKETNSWLSRLLSTDSLRFIVSGVGVGLGNYVKERVFSFNNDAFTILKEKNIGRYSCD
jgi:hypothetical protein